MLKQTILAAAFVLVTVTAQAATLVSPPLYLAPGDDYECAMVNGSTKAVTSVKVDVTIAIANAVLGSGFTESCSSVAPNEACGDFNEAGGGQFRYCTVSFVGSKTYVRAAFCNRTDDVCVPLQ